MSMLVSHPLSLSLNIDVLTRDLLTKNVMCCTLIEGGNVGWVSFSCCLCVHIIKSGVHGECSEHCDSKH